MELTDLRAQLDEVDAQLTDLFVRRMQLIDTVADLKQRDPSRPLYDPVRERAILMKVREKAGLMMPISEEMVVVSTTKATAAPEPFRRSFA